MKMFESKEVYALFGEFAKQGRLRKDLYQYEVGEMLGITQSSYSHIENGSRQISFALILNICEVLDLDINDFMTILKFQHVHKRRRATWHKL